MVRPMATRAPFPPPCAPWTRTQISSIRAPLPLLREDQEGKYYGVGMSIQSRPGKMGKLVTIVVAPIPGSPAFRAGLRPGDVVAKVDGKATDGMNTQQVAEMLKGPKGTQVQVTIVREGYDQPLDVNITRDEISQNSVDDAFMIRPGVAYIHINKFNENTNDELSDALRKLNEKNLQGLVLDLRGNPGGLLQEAVEVCDHFLEKSQLIVYHSGRHSQEKRYYATRGDDGNEYPIVVLINRMSASAAEIVTGALQDHDRALVMGEPSFGKGLVQTVYQLSEHTGLALTTAHYYTPSGRLIQREYENVSLYDYYYHPELTKPNHAEVRLDRRRARSLWRRRNHSRHRVCRSQDDSRAGDAGAAQRLLQLRQSTTWESTRPSPRISK